MIANRGAPRPAWSGSTRAQQLPADWLRRHIRVLTRDGWRCTAITGGDERCTERADEVDHVRRGSDHSFSNLTALRSWRRAKKSAREGATAARFARPSRYRSAEPHPGDTRP